MSDQLAVFLLTIPPLPAAWALIVAWDGLVGWFASAPDSLEEVAV